MSKSIKKHYKKSKSRARKHMKTVIKHKSHKSNKSHKSHKSNKSRKSHKNKKHSLKHMKRAHKKRISFSASRGRRKGLHGGNCGCSGNSMIGGMVSSPGSGPVGYSWNGGNPTSWPGVAASNGTNTNSATMSNHFKTSPNGIAVGGADPYSGSSNMNGGKKNKKQKGGFFQEIVNLGRGAQYGLSSGYYNLIGKEQPISENPYPTQDQPIDNDYKIIGTQAPNVKQIFTNANNKVAKI
ncbi:MAG: hypothetical protein CMJ05_07755 [Pelagibacterales bacterium]|nr:hypothetical protein [Pelagibacterales bacterium]|tara:strand:- start:890 stop:1603 length:714 start_codon:yes stop_codon:yes gene_type:complete